MIQLWSAIGVAILTVVVGPLLRGEVSGRLLRRMAAQAELRGKLEGVAEATKELDALLTAEAQHLRRREVEKLTRKINTGNLAALIFVAVAGGGVVYVLISGALALQGSFLFWVLVVMAATVALFVILLAAVGVGTLHAPPRDRTQK